MLALSLSRVAPFVIAAVLLFGIGYKTSSHFSEITRLKQLEAAVTHYQESLSRAQAKSNEIIEAKVKIKEKIITVIKEVPVYVTEEKDIECAPSSDVVGLLNAARNPELSTTSRSFIEADITPPAVGFRRLIESDIIASGMYNSARFQCNALIEWVTSNYGKQPL